MNKVLAYSFIVALLFFASFLVSKAQTTNPSVIDTVLSGAGPYDPGDTMVFVGIEIFDVTTNNCDRMVVNTVPTTTPINFTSATSVGLGDYWGVSGNTTNGAPPFPAGPRDTVFWVIPCSWAAGSYSLHFFDDEDCIPPTGTSNSFNFVVTSSAPAPRPFDLGYPSDVFCVGQNAVLPSHAIGALTTHTNGSYLDLTSTNSSDDLIANATTGSLLPILGAVGLPHVIEYTDAFTNCTYVDTIEVIMPTVRDTFSYAGTSFCKDLDSIAPNNMPTQNGNFSIFPTSANFAINSSTGVINLTNLNPGAYSVKYTPDPDSCLLPFTYNLSVIAVDSGDFIYKDEYCLNDALGGWPDSIFHLPTGIFQEAFGGTSLTINSGTGRIDLLNTPSGTYHVEFVPSATCRVIKRDSFIVRPPAPVSLFMDTVVCSDLDTLKPFSFSLGAQPFLLVSGYMAPPDSSTGAIPIAGLSTPGGPYTISLGNGDIFCPDTIQHHITIIEKDSAAITYGSTLFCQGDIDPIPTFLFGGPGGIFSISGAGVIDSGTGVIDLSQCPPATYNVTYNTGGATCPNTLIVASPKVDSTPDATFDFIPQWVCKDAGTTISLGSFPSAPNPTIKVTSMSGVLFSGAISGNSLVMDSLPVGGPYKLVRTATIAGCTDTFVDYFNVIGRESANFVYIPDRYCTADQNPSPLILGTPGGLFTIDTTNGAPTIDMNTGVVALNVGGAIGSHLIKYRTQGLCPDSAYYNIVVESAASPLFSLEQTSLCLDTLDTLNVTLGAGLDTIPHFFTIVAQTQGGNQSIADSAIDVQLGNVNMGILQGAMNNDTTRPDTFLLIYHLAIQQGACADSFVASFTVHQPNANAVTLSFDTLGDNSFCKTEGNVQAILTGTYASKGHFYSIPPFLGWALRDSGLAALATSPADTYIVQFVIGNVCNDVVEYELILEEPTDNELVYQNYLGDTVNSFCRGDTNLAYSHLLATNPGIFGIDTILSSNTNGIVFDSSGNIDLVNSLAGNYIITFSESSGCPATATTEFFLRSGPLLTSVDIIPSSTFCFGETITIETSGGLKWKVFVNEDSIGASNVLVYPPPLSNYPHLVQGDSILVEISDEYGCSVFHNIKPTVNPIPDIIAYPPTLALDGNDSIKFLLEATVDSTAFVWNVLGRGSIESFSRNQDSLFLANTGQSLSLSTLATLNSSINPGVATFYITPVANGCYGAEDTIIVNLNPNNLPIFVPEVFTPDMNGFNDTWEIQWSNSINANDYEVFVYNRQGGQVHYMDHLHPFWDGGNLPDGVYWYNIRSKVTQESYQKGGLTIRRR